MGDRPVVRPLTYTGQHKQKKIRIHTPNSLSKCLSGRRYFVPQTARPLWPATSNLFVYKPSFHAPTHLLSNLSVLPSIHSIFHLTIRTSSHSANHSIMPFLNKFIQSFKDITMIRNISIVNTSWPTLSQKSRNTLSSVSPGTVESFEFRKRGFKMPDAWRLLTLHLKICRPWSLGIIMLCSWILNVRQERGVNSPPNILYKERTTLCC
jgi:hypothetical protein